MSDILNNLTGGGGGQDINSLIGSGGVTPGGFNPGAAARGGPGTSAMVPDQGKIQKLLYLQMLMNSPVMRGRSMPTGTGIANILLPMLASRAMAPMYQQDLANKQTAGIEQSALNALKTQKLSADTAKTQAETKAIPERLSLQQEHEKAYQKRIDQLDKMRQEKVISDETWRNAKLDLTRSHYRAMEGAAADAATGIKGTTVITDPNDPTKTIRVGYDRTGKLTTLGGAPPKASTTKPPPLADNPDVSTEQINLVKPLIAQYRKQAISGINVAGINRQAQSVDPNKPQQVNQLIDSVASMMVNINPNAAKTRLTRNYLDMITEAQTSADQARSTLGRMVFTGSRINPKGVAALKEVAQRISQEAQTQQDEVKDIFRGQIYGLDKRPHVRKSLEDIVFGTSGEEAPASAAPTGQKTAAPKTGRSYKIGSGPLKGTIIDNIDTLLEMKRTGKLTGREQIDEEQ